MPSRPAPPSADLIARFAAIVGGRHALTAADDTRPYLIEWRDRYEGVSPLVLRPGSTAEVAAILKLASETGTPIVPQGGNTGLVGGQVPDESGTEIVLSLGRLDRIRAIDPAASTMTAEAGVILDRIHDAADAVDRLFPLTLGSQGSCTIGGNLSSNAGGTAVLAYGNARDMVLGLEVVLPTGEIVEGLRALRKDNAGYDLKQLFLGTEGTLGVITAAVLKLWAKPKAQEVAVAGVATPADALAALGLAKTRAGAQLTAFEIMPRRLVEFYLAHQPGSRDPLSTPAPWYLLVEVSVGTGLAEARALMEAVLEDGLAAGLIQDATIAQSVAQAKDFWRMRHGMSEVQKHEGGSIKHDVSLPLSALPDFLARATEAVERLVPGCRPVPFGHLGDGNIHFNVSQPVGGDKAAFLAGWEAMNAVVHGIVTELGGSIAAEHGVGRMKRAILAGVRSPVEMMLMRRLKATLDPAGILNPGKVV
ncbi:hydroxyacid dehydrogenase [Prosthecomicrobium hirschii]|uniref:Hydroxyacid dehydrogenase n=1 Tax=Prosthecodimorpha hirschii TaxID=665126 RepID=A0A0P6W3M0_9HYPH|nr:FAD-binding oxidoreductase [Prosthecomicrobium hirschii]KPL52037.1 hydroxyacid dehydrogenase [Prosthecomicrobium hirschii]